LAGNELDKLIGHFLGTFGSRVCKVSPEQWVIRVAKAEVAVTEA
jgi:hypothetical protein